LLFGPANGTNVVIRFKNPSDEKILQIYKSKIELFFHGGGLARAALNVAGPIVDMTAGGTIASTSPWANFSY
jgi:hypothetical protein